MLKNVAGQKWTVFAFDVTTNLPKTGDAANITANLRLDGAGANAVDDTNPSELEDGYYEFDITQAESNADHIVICPSSTTADIVVVGVPGAVWTRSVPLTVADIAAGVLVDPTYPLVTDTDGGALVSGFSTGAEDQIAAAVPSAATIASTTAAAVLVTPANKLATDASGNAAIAADQSGVTVGTVNSLGSQAKTDVADAIWDEVLDTTHEVAGSASVLLQDAGAAGDPWSAALPGAYGAGTAGEIVGALVGIGDNLEGVGIQVAKTMVIAVADLSNSGFSASCSITVPSGMTFNISVQSFELADNRISSTVIQQLGVLNSSGWTVDGGWSAPTSGDTIVIAANNTSGSSFGPCTLTLSGTCRWGTWSQEIDFPEIITGVNMIARPAPFSGTVSRMAGNGIGWDTRQIEGITVADIEASTILAMKSDIPTVGDIADGVWDELQAGHVSAGTFGIYLDSPVSEAGGSTFTLDEIADAVWDEVLDTAHEIAGSASVLVQGAASAGDPWGTALPGEYGAGTAGEILAGLAEATAVEILVTPENKIATGISGVVDADVKLIDGDATAATRLAAVANQTRGVTLTEDYESAKTPAQAGDEMALTSAVITAVRNGLSTLDAAGIRSAIGMASNNLDYLIEVVRASAAAVEVYVGEAGVVVAPASKTGYSLAPDQSGVTVGTTNALGTQAKADVAGAVLVTPANKLAADSNNRVASDVQEIAGNATAASNLDQIARGLLGVILTIAYEAAKTAVDQTALDAAVVSLSELPQDYPTLVTHEGTRIATVTWASGKVWTYQYDAITHLFTGVVRT